MSAILEALRKRGGDEVLTGPEEREEDGGRYLLGDRPRRRPAPRTEPRPSNPSGANLFLFAFVLLLTVPVSVVTTLWVTRTLWTPPSPTATASSSTAAVAVHEPDPGADPAGSVMLETAQRRVEPDRSLTSQEAQTGSAGHAAPDGASMVAGPPSFPAGAVFAVPPMQPDAAPGYQTVTVPAGAGSQQQTMVAVPWPIYYPQYGTQAPPAGWPGYYPPQSPVEPERTAHAYAPPAIDRAEAAAPVTDTGRETVAAITPRSIVFDGVIGNRAILADSLYAVGDEVEGLVISEIGPDYVAFRDTQVRARVR